MPDKQKSDRRTFLKKAAAAGAGGVAGAAALNAVAPALLPEKMVFEENHSHWANALPTAKATLDHDLEADIAVIGGGFTGLSAAYYASNSASKPRVVLLEARRCGNGASGRNGAMLLTSTEDRYMNWSGDAALDKRIYDLTVNNIARLQELSRSFGIDAEIEQSGALQVCNTRELAEGGREYVEKARRVGFPCEFWEREKVTDAIGTRAYEGAMFEPNSGQAHPGKLVELLKAAAQSGGAEIFEDTPVVRVEEAERITLTTSRGRTVRARAVVLATNAFTSKLGYLRRATTPVFDYVAITAPLSEAQLAAVGWKRRIPFNDMRTEVFYLGLTKDNRLHIGGGPVDYVFNNGVAQPANAEKRFARLREEMGRIFPALAQQGFETVWSGAVDMTLDGSPTVGQMGKHGNIFYALGFSGHGVNLTSVFGRILADLIDGKSQDWAWLPYLNRLPAYIPNEPFRWAGVQAALGYYRLTDPSQP